MKVFISWSGERSQMLAQAMHGWLPLVLHYVEPWVSKSDVDAGERWASEVGKELQASNFGIVCITRENINSAWILFEAGALAKSMETGRVIPLLLDIEFKDISGPLAQFQAKKVERTSISDIVTSINKLDPQAVPEQRLTQLIDSLWPNLEMQVSKIPPPSGPTKHNRPQHEILEELVSGVRGLDLRFRESIDDSIPLKRRRQRHHPMMIEEMSHALELRRGDPLRMLMAASIFRDDFPWLFELAAEAYRSHGSPRATRANRKLREALSVLSRGPFLREFARDKETHFLLREMEHMLFEGIGPPDATIDDEESESLASEKQAIEAQRRS